MTKKRLLSLSLSLLFSFVVLGVLWIFPALQSSAEEERQFGTSRSLSWTANAEKSQQFVWEYWLNVTREPDTIDVWPRLPFSTNVSRGPQPGESNLVTTFRVFVGNQQIGYRTHGSGTGDYSTKTTVGEPQYFEELRQGFLVKGANRIRIVVDVALDVVKPGTESFRHELGPARITIYSADRDGDGVEDEDQIVPFFSGLAAIPVALVTGGAIFWVLQKRLLPRAAARTGASKPSKPQRSPSQKP